MRHLVPLASIILLACVSILCADEHDADRAAGFFSPEDIEWREGPGSLPPGAKLAVLEGDPTKEGAFVMRLLMPDGYSIPPHTHPKIERLTVISGIFHIAMGEKLDKKSGRKMPAGAFGYWAAGMKHFVWGEGETVVQLHGMGPWSIKYLKEADDPRNKPK
jgi:hypothetical protein